jgi:hypothetical protein
MSMLAALALYASALYAALGICVGLAFVVLGVTRILPQPATVTIPARVLAVSGRGCPVAGGGAAMAAGRAIGGPRVTRTHRSCTGWSGCCWPWA